jgi:hypothetical protein
MLPRRKLSEIVISARLNKKFCNLLVEGPSDHIILRSYCEGASLPTVIYPIPSVEVDCVPSGEGGNRGRLIAVSEFAASKQIERTFCVIDRDHWNFISFDFNSHCMITDLGCLDMYALHINEMRGYLNRSYHLEMTTEQMRSIIESARVASCLQWARETLVKGVSLASLEHSLSIGSESEICIDLQNWLTRSRARGGTPVEWNALEATLPNIGQNYLVDSREEISVHQFDEVVRFWLRRVGNVTLPPRWAEGHLRGLATYERLQGYEFFNALAARCRLGVN